MQNDVSINKRQRKALNQLILACAAVMLLIGCSMKRAAVNLAGDAISGGGQAYSSDDDPEFIREALPFGIKVSEGLLEESPAHRGLLLTVAKGYAVYAYLLQDEADRTEAFDFSKARTLQARACKFYLRSRDYALRGLCITNLSADLFEQVKARIPLTAPEDVPFLYWAAVSWAGALSAAKDDLKLISELPVPGMMARRILQLDEAFEGGAAHEFLISYEGSRPGGSTAAARRHFQRALDLSKSRRASVYLALAESVAIREQNAPEFRSLLKAALAIDPNRDPELRLSNTIARKRAEWLLNRLADIFLDPVDTEAMP
ncbi:MAG: TRAP transporter TatT component family protein [Hyphomicrobiales bacterium]